MAEYFEGEANDTDQLLQSVTRGTGMSFLFSTSCIITNDVRFIS